MKYIILLSLLISAAASAQTPIQSYTQAPIDIGPANLGRDTVDGVILKRYAEFSAMTLNSRTKEVALQIKCYVRTNTNDKAVGIRPVWVELKASANTYNLVSNGNPIGSINDVLNAYGIRDTAIVDGQQVIDWKKDANGKYLTTVAVMDGWSTYTSMMDNQSITLRNVIRQTMLRPANIKVMQDAIKSQIAAVE